MSDLITIKTYSNRAEADLDKNILEQNGIKAMSTADDCGGLRPDLMFSTCGAKLVVRKEDVEKVKEILNIEG